MPHLTSANRAIKNEPPIARARTLLSLQVERHQMNHICTAILASLLLLASHAAHAQAFQFAGTYPINYNAEGYSLGIGDLNGDGILDLAVAEEFGGPGGFGGIAILLGNSDGTFQRVYYVSSEPEPVDLVLADFNHDGHLDILTDSFFGSYTNVYVQLGNGDGTFQSAVSFPGIGIVPVVGDFNNDGNLDVALESFVYPTDTDFNLLLGNGDGTFQPAITTVLKNASALGVVLADLNGDGKLDAVAAGGNRISILLGKGDGTFNVNFDQRPNPIQTDLGPLVAADFNRDGKTDIVVIDVISNTIRLFPGNGDGTFQPPLKYVTLIYPTQVATADFDDDGNPDLAVVDRYSNGISVLHGQGNGKFGAPSRFADSVNVSELAIADVNRDGLPDLVMVTFGQVVIFDNTGMP